MTSVANNVFESLEAKLFGLAEANRLLWILLGIIAIMFGAAPAVIGGWSRWRLARWAGPRSSFATGLYWSLYWLWWGAFWCVVAAFFLPIDLAAEAARCALLDTGVAETLPDLIDTVAMIRLFSDSPNRPRLLHNFGRAENPPRAVARRIGNISNITEKDRPDNVILGHTVHDVATAARRSSADVWVVYRRPITEAPATKHELDAVIREGVEIHDRLSPLEVILDDMGRAKALKVAPVESVDGKLQVKEDEACTTMMAKSRDLFVSLKWIQ